jgi:DHA1 family multidrug resistance protein-like MFS transporter
VSVVEEKQRGPLTAILSDPGVGAVMTLALLVNLALGLVLPILPLYARSLGADYAQAGLLVAAFYVARLMFDLIGGYLVERLGIAAASAIGLLVLGAGAALTALSRSFPPAVASWAAAGAGAAIVWAAMYTGLIRFVPKPRIARAVGVFYGAFNSGIIAGGFIGGLLASRFGSRAPLVVLAGLAFGLVVFANRSFQLAQAPTLPSPASGGGKVNAPTLPSPASGGGKLNAPASGGGTFIELLRIPGFVGAVVSLLAHLWLYGSVFSTLVPLFSREVLGISPFGIGVLFAVALAAEFVAYIPAGMLADRRGRRFLLIPAFTALTVSCFLLGFARNPFLLALMLAAVGAGMGFAAVSPASMLADVVPENRSAIGVAIFRFGGDLGFSIGPLVCGITAAHYGFTAAFIVAGIPCLIALAVVTLGPETLAMPRTA